MACVYKIDFPNGKSYIGFTSKTAMVRFNSHCSKSSLKEDKYKQSVSRAISKYGKENCKLTTLFCGSYYYCIGLEDAAIKLYGTMSPNGYNVSSGGIGCSLSKEQIKKRAETLRQTLSSESKRKLISERSKASFLKEETKIKHKESCLKNASKSDVRNRLLLSLEKARRDEEINKRRIESIRLAMSNEDVFANRVKKSAEAKRTPENRKAVSDKMKEMWADPEFRKKVAEGIIKRKLLIG